MNQSPDNDLIEKILNKIEEYRFRGWIDLLFWISDREVK